MRDLVEQIRAEIDQDELWALAASSPRWEDQGGLTLRTVEEWPLNYGGPDNTLPVSVCEGEEVRTGDGGHIVRHDPARVLRDVEAHRAILVRHGPGVSHPEECGRCNDPWPCGDVLALASMYGIEDPAAAQQRERSEPS